MSEKKNSSLFDQSLDRSVFVTFFLSAIVPLIGVALLSERLLPSLTDRDEQLGLVALVVATGILSLGSFLALRRIVFSTVEEMNKQNARLESLLEVARELADAPHKQAVIESSALWAGRLTLASATWFLTRDDWEKPLEAACERGDSASQWLEANQEEWAELLYRSADTAEPIRIDSSDPTSPSILMAPLTGELDAQCVLVVAREARPFAPSEVDALCTLAALSGVAIANTERGDSQRNFFSHMTDFVLAALDTHVDYRRGHATRVAENANRVGRAMGLDDEALHDLQFAALLHDVGMLKIPRANQRDPRFFKKHPSVAEKMLSRIRVWHDAAPIVGQHHERLDGTGYPDGLVGDDICLGARILSVCDAWDAMRSEDVDRAAIPEHEALAELHAHTGTQFDADVVRAVEALIEQGLF